MKKILILGMILPLLSFAQEKKLPKVFKGDQPDLLGLNLKMQAAEAFEVLQIPEGSSWQSYSKDIKDRIIANAGIVIDHNLPLDFLETGKQQLDGYTVRNIRFQTRPGVYATASLYVPDGEGKFPAVITTHGHWDAGRRSEIFQAIGHSLAKDGYVCLIMDAWGAGERTTEHEIHEYHGANLGASLMNIGETLLGMQVTDNIRGVDLLSSLTYVDAENIGATGASGGGNQVMWLAAMDERVKVAIPVVSVGTFQSYILNSNCVCELLPNGLTFTEEAAVLGLIAPRSLKIISAFRDANLAFNPTQMFRSYHPLSNVYENLGVKDKLSYQIFDTGHGYWPEMREAMLGWFDLQLKGKGQGFAKREAEFKFLSIESLATYPKGEREIEVLTTVGYNHKRGKELRSLMLNDRYFDKKAKKDELEKLLIFDKSESIDKVFDYGAENGWDKLSLKSSSGRLIPVLHRAPEIGSEYILLVHSGGKDSIPYQHIADLIKLKKGIVLADLWGTGERESLEATKIDGALPPFHTLSRSVIWLGSTVMGEWVKEINLLNELLVSKFHASQITIEGYKEAGIAAVLEDGIYGDQYKDRVQGIVTYDSPYSYLFDSREGINFFDMAVHVPGILKWGDISIASALANARITFVNARSMSGIIPVGERLDTLKSEFELFEKKTGKKQRTTFIKQ